MTSWFEFIMILLGAFFLMGIVWFFSLLFDKSGKGKNENNQSPETNMGFFFLFILTIPAAVIADIIYQYSFTQLPFYKEVNGVAFAIASFLLIMFIISTGLRIFYGRKKSASLSLKTAGIAMKVSGILLVLLAGLLFSMLK